MVKVAKFGGSSLATRSKVDNVIGLIVSDPEVHYVVVSAPGKQDSADIKITDLLIGAIHDTGYQARINKRFAELCFENSGLAANLANVLDERLEHDDLDSIKAFGEYAMARVVADTLNAKGHFARFLDVSDLGFRALVNASYSQPVQPDPDCYEDIGRVLRQYNGIIVIPGFYAVGPDGRIITFPRNGSDITGAVIANAVNADIYENWTDTDGLQRADPSVVDSPGVIKEITYEEARELAYLGFKLQEDAILPAAEAHIPIRVKNSEKSDLEGTLVVHDRLVSRDETIVGVAAKKGFYPLIIYKSMMGYELGIGRKVFEVLEKERIPYEHSPTGMDTISVIIHGEYLKGPGRVHSLIRQLNESCGSIDAKIGDPMALVVVAGLGMKNHPDIPARVLSALGKKSIYPTMLNAGASPVSFFIGVEERQAEDSVRAIYQEFYSK